MAQTFNLSEWYDSALESRFPQVNNALLDLSLLLWTKYQESLATGDRTIFESGREPSIEFIRQFTRVSTRKLARLVCPTRLGFKMVGVDERQIIDAMDSASMHQDFTSLHVREPIPFEFLNVLSRCAVEDHTAAAQMFNVSNLLAMRMAKGTNNQIRAAVGLPIRLAPCIPLCEIKQITGDGDQLGIGLSMVRSLAY